MNGGCQKFVTLNNISSFSRLKIKLITLKSISEYQFIHIQGVPTLCDKSNLVLIVRKIGQIAKVKVFS